MRLVTLLGVLLLVAYLVILTKVPTIQLYYQ